MGMEKIRHFILHRFILGAALCLSFSYVSPVWGSNTCESVFQKINNADQSPSIPDLREVTEISDEIYNSFEVNDIARAIINRWRSLELQKDGALQALRKERFNNRKKTAYYRSLFGPNEFNLETQTEIVLFFHPKAIDSIATTGFQNLHQTGTTQGGDQGFVKRAPYEDAFTDIKMGFSEKAKRLRPKSAFVNISAPLDLSPTKHALYSYGPIGAVMKNHVKERSLLSDGDSYLMGYGLLEAPIGDWLRRNRDDLHESLGTFKRGFVPTNSDNAYYYEALVYGDVTLADVASFYLIQSNFRSQNQLNLALRKLKQYGIPIDLAEQKIINNRMQIVPVKRLFTPK